MKTVLVVEDSPESFELVKRSLQSIANIEWARSAQEADELLRTLQVDLVLLDISLPDRSGFEVCSTLRDSDPLKKLPVIMFSASHSSSDRVLGFSMGADDFIPKPIDLADLKTRISAKLKESTTRAVFGETGPCPRTRLT